MPKLQILNWSEPYYIGLSVVLCALQSQKSIKVSRQQGSPSLYVWFAADWQRVENLTNTLKYQFADVKIHSMYGLYQIFARWFNHIIYTVNL